MVSRTSTTSVLRAVLIQEYLSERRPLEQSERDRNLLLGWSVYLTYLPFLF